MRYLEAVLTMNHVMPNYIQLRVVAQLEVCSFTKPPISLS